MKGQVCAAILVVTAGMVVGAKQEENPMEFWISFFHNELFSICGENMCWPESEPCLNQMDDGNYTTEEEVQKAKEILMQCATIIGVPNADFSTITMEKLDAEFSNDKDPSIKAKEYIKFMNSYGIVGKKLQHDMLRCSLNMNGELPKLKECIKKAKDEENNGTESTN